MRKLVTLMAFAIMLTGCTTDVVPTQSELERKAKKRNEVVLASTVTDGTVIEYLQGLEVVEVPRGNVRNYNWITFPNDFTGDTYFRGSMYDENFNFLVIDDVSFGQYPTNGTNGYALAGSLESGVVYYLRLKTLDTNEVVFVQIIL